MGDISKQIAIAAPASRIFSFVADPRNAPRYISAISRVSTGIYEAPAEGQIWGAEANFLGRQSHIRLQITRLIAGALAHFTLLDDPYAILSVRLDPAGGQTTMVTMSLDVPSVPGILLTGLMGGMVSSDLARLKQLMEGQ